MTYKIGLVTPSPQSHRTAEETLGLGYLSAVLRLNGYDVCVVDGWLESLSVEEIVEKLSFHGNISMVGMSCYRSNITEAIEVLQAIRKKFGNIPVICGGYGPTFHEQLFLESGFDVIVMGEAEHIIVPLAQALLSGCGLEKITGVSFLKGDKIFRNDRNEPAINLDQLPFPSRENIRSTIGQRNFVHVCTSRGCQAHCGFCSIFSFAKGVPGKNYWRHRSVGNIVDELRYLHEHFGVTNFKFVDDSFIEPPRDALWVEQFRREISKHSLSIKFRTQVRADRLNSDIVRGLKEAGWFSTSVGVENFSDTALRRMAKSASKADNFVAIELLSAEKIYTQMGMILFDPYTTISELFENLIFLKKYWWPITKGIFTEMYAADGTVFTKKLEKRGLLQRDTVMQNHVYTVQDILARRVYFMLKVWHRSHSAVYDWVIDSLTAPKVLKVGDYEAVYALYRKLQSADIEFFDGVLAHVTGVEGGESDSAYVESSIKLSSHMYFECKREIEEIYKNNQLFYRAVPNPFLGSD